jgi:hypothetical protein
MSYQGTGPVMPRTKTTLVARAGYSGVGGVWDSIKGAGSSVLSSVNKYYQDKGAAEYYKNQPPATSSGMPDWLLPVGLVAGGLGVIWFLKRRKS